MNDVTKAKAELKHAKAEQLTIWEQRTVQGGQVNTDVARQSAKEEKTATRQPRQ